MQKSTLVIGFGSVYSSMLDCLKRSPSLEFDEGINEGLHLAKEIFWREGERFVRPGSRIDAKIWQAGCIVEFGELLKEKRNSPHLCDDHAEGVNEGLDLALQVFEQFAREQL